MINETGGAGWGLIPAHSKCERDLSCKVRNTTKFRDSPWIFEAKFGGAVLNFCVSVFKGNKYVITIWEPIY